MAWWPVGCGRPIAYSCTDGMTVGCLCGWVQTGSGNTQRAQGCSGTAAAIRRRNYSLHQATAMLLAATESAGKE
eukprot:363423-Chlamydomonas_euryale.AAC.2